VDERERELLSRTGVAPPLWRKHQALARNLARSYYAPGHEPQDLEQVALIALWEAARSYDPDKGPFKSFAVLVIRRRLYELIKNANAQKNLLVSDAVREYDAPQPVIEEDSRGQLRMIVERMPRLSLLERYALARSLNGCPILNKRHDNALQRARRKLAA
jgi:RNA polymerase sigma factor (sigma-70 family)